MLQCNSCASGQSKSEIWSLTGMSKRGGGGRIAVTRGLCDAYLSKLIEGIKTNQPEVKASKSDNWLRSYGHLKFCVIFHGCYPCP